ncbi:hypothetical protein AB0O82_32660 [Kitasatospora sp. NPDC088264]|uniref:hypothetical protein n=1 Tax=Kitasatospora sp. NPDC088264 TaxID=3155296 RepID=UPI0034426867
MVINEFNGTLPPGAILVQGRDFSGTIAFGDDEIRIGDTVITAGPRTAPADQEPTGTEVAL